MKTRTLTYSILTVSGLALFSPVFLAAADDPPPQDRKEQAERAERQARQAKEQAERADAAVQEQRQATERQLDELRAHLKDLVAEGHMEEAAQVKKRLATLKGRQVRQRQELARPEREGLPPREKIERQMAELREQGRPEEAERLERELRERTGPEGRPEPREMESRHPRLEHLNAAIENLRMAGLPGIAERLEQLANRFRQGLERQGPPARIQREERQRIQRAPGQPGQALEEIHRNLDQLRAEVEELHQAMRKMQARLEERAR
jgi:hypothetical protein